MTTNLTRSSKLGEMSSCSCMGGEFSQIQNLTSTKPGETPGNSLIANWKGPKTLQVRVKEPMMFKLSSLLMVCLRVMSSKADSAIAIYSVQWVFWHTLDQTWSVSCSIRQVENIAKMVFIRSCCSEIWGPILSLSTIDSWSRRAANRVLSADFTSKRTSKEKFGRLLLKKRTRSSTAVLLPLKGVLSIKLSQSWPTESVKVLDWMTRRLKRSSTMGNCGVTCAPIGSEIGLWEREVRAVATLMWVEGELCRVTPIQSSMSTKLKESNCCSWGIPGEIRPNGKEPGEMTPKNGLNEENALLMIVWSLRGRKLVRLGRKMASFGWVSTTFSEILALFSCVASSTNRCTRPNILKANGVGSN